MPNNFMGTLGNLSKFKVLLFIPGVKISRNPEQLKNLHPVRNARFWRLDSCEDFSKIPPNGQKQEDSSGRFLKIPPAEVRLNARFLGAIANFWR